MKRLTSLLLALAAMAAASVAPGSAPRAETAPAGGARVKVAVAANFTDAAKEIAAAFRRRTGNEALLSFGSTGQLYSQITQGAPFQVFLAADQVRPEKVVKDGLGIADSRFTYAIGRLVLWSRAPGLVKDGESLKHAGFSKLAICNPVAAPYGAAAVQAMKALKVYDSLKPKLVIGANVTQAFQFIDTGNAELGFVALSQLAGRTKGDAAAGSRWIVPQVLYSPIRQDAVLLKTGSGAPAAAAFMAFLKGPQARAIIESYGYAFAPQG